MKREKVIVEPFKLVGLAERTCNKNEFNPEVQSVWRAQCFQARFLFRLVKV